MRRINSLNDLLMEELADLLNAENQLAEALPKMAQASELPALKETLEKYFEITMEHVSRLEDIFSNLGQNPSNPACKAMKGLIAECVEAINKTEKSSARDNAITSAIQRVEEYEITEYKKAREHAADLGHTRIVELFTKTLNEQRAMSFHVNELAQYMINAQATDHKGGGFYVPEGKFRRRSAKNKIKSKDVSRFISEGNPNLQNPEEQGDFS